MKTYNLSLFFLLFILITSCKIADHTSQPVFQTTSTAKIFTIKNPIAAYNNRSGRYDIFFTVVNNSTHTIKNASFKFDFYSFNNVQIASVDEPFILNIKPTESKTITYFIYLSDTEIPQKILITPHFL